MCPLADAQPASKLPPVPIPCFHTWLRVVFSMQKAEPCACRVLMDLAAPRPSDKYNVVQPQQSVTVSSAGGGERGLLGSAFSAAGGLGGGAALSRGLGSLRPCSSGEEQRPAVAEFLVPFGGLDRYYPPPSPVKPALAVRPQPRPCRLVDQPICGCKLSMLQEQSGMVMASKLSGTPHAVSPAC